MLRLFASFVLGFSLLGTVAGLMMPQIIFLTNKPKLAEFGLKEFTAEYSAAQSRERMPEIVMGTALSLVGVVLGVGLLRRKEWARKGWLLVCAGWLLAILLAQILEPDWSAVGLTPLLLRGFIFGVSCWVLLSDSARRQFCSNT